MNLPKGFLGSAVAAGLRKKPGLDVALLVAPGRRASKTKPE